MIRFGFLRKIRNEFIKEEFDKFKEKCEDEIEEQDEIENMGMTMSMRVFTLNLNFHFIQMNFVVI